MIFTFNDMLAHVPVYTSSDLRAVYDMHMQNSITQMEEQYRLALKEGEVFIEIYGE